MPARSQLREPGTLGSPKREGSGPGWALPWESRARCAGWRCGSVEGASGVCLGGGIWSRPRGLQGGGNDSLTPKPPPQQLPEKCTSVLFFFSNLANLSPPAAHGAEGKSTAVEGQHWQGGHQGCEVTSGAVAARRSRLLEDQHVRLVEWHKRVKPVLL